MAIERTLIVGNISPGTSPHDLRTLFSKVATVTTVEVRSLIPTTASALVSMYERGAAAALEQLDGRVWRGHALTVRKYQPSYQFDEHDDPDPW